jgi:conjugative transfer region lipoprotein (TIGR03751 family)
MTRNLNCKLLVTAVCLGTLLLSGCSTSKEEMLPAGDTTMLDLWNGADGGGRTARQAAVARDMLRRPLTDNERRKGTQGDRSYSRTQESEISQQFPRLPNPDMVMYLYPHLAGGNTPVPGYSTVFPFYSQTQYAMPGERTEAL